MKRLTSRIGKEPLCWILNDTAMNRICLITLFFVLGSNSIAAQTIPSQDFSFVFMTDIHLEYAKRAVEGFMKAIDTANRLDADFVLTGGDLVADALGATHSTADSLYALYIETIKNFHMPVYNTIGNHELFGFYKESESDSLDPDYGDGMFKRYLGKTYYSFDHKGWHFIVLNSIVEGDSNSYIGYVDEEQMNWLKNDLELIDTNMPIIVSTHIPFVSTYNQFREGSLAPNEDWMVITNSMDVLEMLSPYNLKLVLQGHLHMIEFINIQNNFEFLVGGAVSASWWEGPLDGMEEGFVKIDIRGDDISWNYIDFGWEAVEE